MTTLSATEFKSKCLTLMDRVQATGETICITKHGKEVARLVPSPNLERKKKLLQQLKSSVKIKSDLTKPTFTESEIDVVLGQDERKLYGPSH